MPIKLPTSKWKKFLLFFGINTLLIFLIAILLFSYPTIKNINDIEIISINGNEVKCKVNSEWRNNNFFSIAVKQIYFKGTYKNTTFLEGRSDSRFRLAARGNSKVEAICNLDLNKISTFWNDFIQNDSVAIQVDYEGSFTRFGVSKSGSMQVYFKCKRMLDLILTSYLGGTGLAFENLSISKTGFMNWVWSFDLKLFNKFPSDILLRKININIYPEKNNKIPIGNYLLNKSINLLAQQEGIIPGQITIGIGGLMNGIASKTMTRNLRFYMKGNIEVEINENSFVIPIEKNVAFNPLTQEIKIVK